MQKRFREYCLELDCSANDCRKYLSHLFSLGYMWNGSSFIPEKTLICLALYRIPVDGNFYKFIDVMSNAFSILSGRDKTNTSII